VLIVCHLVDHYGDAGVCLRLAKGLAARQCRVQLVIDQPALIVKMSPSLPGNVRVTEGLTALEACAVPDLLIEAFQHDAPFEFRMAQDLVPGNTDIVNIAGSGKDWEIQAQIDAAPTPDEIKAALGI
jgi:hypothetical protein